MPARAPRTKACQKWNDLLIRGSYSIVWIGSGSSCSSKSNRVTAVACSEKTEKFTPFAPGTAPNGCGEPRSTVNWDALERLGLALFPLWTCPGLLFVGSTGATILQD